MNFDLFTFRKYFSKQFNHGNSIITFGCSNLTFQVKKFFHSATFKICRPLVRPTRAARFSALSHRERISFEIASISMH